MSAKPVRKSALPGDVVAVPEEFIPGRHVYETEGAIRSLMVGGVVRDMKKREVRVRPSVSRRVPAVKDWVLGQIEVAQMSSGSLKIRYINGKPSDSDLSGNISFRSSDQRRDRERGPPPVTLGDIVRAKVVSTLNGITQLSLDDPHAGVVFTRCSNCGRPMAPVNGRAKCTNCGNIEERKFADDFGREGLEP